jgi:hypothetical protein
LSKPVLGLRELRYHNVSLDVIQRVLILDVSSSLPVKGKEKKRKAIPVTGLGGL